MSENTTVDLFAGCGGMSTGFGQAPAPFRVVVANEMDRAAAETYRRNHPGVPVVEGDITRPEVKDAVVAAGAAAQRA